MHGSVFCAKKRVRRTAACFLAALVLATTTAAAAEEKTERRLVPVGHTVGIKLFSQGVLVVKLPEGATPARECGLKTGDVILQCGVTDVTSIEQFQSLLQRSGTGTTDLRVRRGSDTLTLAVEPEQNENGVCCIGAWIRDSMAGIGTMTYYDPETREFGALGHGITDVDTALLMPFRSGAVLPSAVKAVRKGERGRAGELRGDFDLTRDVGVLSANTANGVFGTMTDDYEPISGEALAVGTAAPGAAILRSNIAGDTVEDYAVEILRASEVTPDGRDLVLCITDPRLLETTGGIVQGMSGSPILQDGKLVGALTHVFLNDPAKGYGIQMNTMLRAEN